MAILQKESYVEDHEKRIKSIEVTNCNLWKKSQKQLETLEMFQKKIYKLEAEASARKARQILEQNTLADELDRYKNCIKWEKMNSIMKKEKNDGVELNLDM